MQKFPTIEVPSVILNFCRHEEPTLNLLMETISNDQFLLNLLHASYPKELTKRNIREFFSGLGVEKSMLYISSIYVQKTLFKTNPGQVDETIIKKLEQFYTDCMQYADDPFRVVLLTTYLGLIDSHFRTYYKNSRNDYLKFPAVVKTILSAATDKIYHFDFLYLLLLQLDDIESLENIQKFLVEGKTFINLYKTLPEDKQKGLSQNFITYGQAIKEIDFFTKGIDTP